MGSAAGVSFFLTFSLFLVPPASCRTRVAMKSNMQKKGSTAQAPSRHVVGTRKVKKGIKTQKGLAQKASGVLPVSATEVLGQQLSKSKPSIGTRKETVEVDPLAKIKLQLFPVDEVTRIGLEKDGHNPFLELTLKASKKISSVIKHIHTKWGGSSIAIGEPMLLPYDVYLRHPAMSRRWTSKDTIITAGDVHTAVESPAIFRLSYGWFSDHEPQRVSSATAPHNCRLSENMPKQFEKTEERKCLDATAEVAVTEHMDNEVNMSHTHEFPRRHDDMTILTVGGLLSETSGMEKISNNVLRSSGQPISLCTDISIGGLLSETSLQGKHHNNNDLVFNGMDGSHQQTTIQLDDSLTALSIGGLLSEASLLAKINKSNPKSTETCISDSLDAIIFSKLKSSPKPSSLETRSSILDAEETCHAFAFRKFSSNKNVRVSARASQDLSSNSFRIPHLPEDLPEVEKEGVHVEEASCPEPKMEPFPRLQQFGEDSRSLGLRDITWNESLGPFDLGNSRPWKVSDGNSMPWKVFDGYIRDS